MGKNVDEILEILLGRNCLDGRRVVFGKSIWPGEEGSIVPPILATFHEAKQQARGKDQPDYVRALMAFEALSRKARGALLGLSLEREVYGKNLPEIVEGFPTIHATDLVDAIAAGAAKFVEEGNNSADPDYVRSTGARLVAEGQSRQEGRRGLQVVGYYIDGDVNLSNLHLPFSVRFIGCVINGAVTAHHTEIVTLDLCGSALRGVFATALQASGSVRLRRTVSLAPIDFGGARISGSLDATDCVVLPINPPPNRDSYAGDRGVFHLALASIGAEMYAGRARIYGGVCMNAASIGRSLYLEDAALHAPISVIQRMAKSHARRRSFIDIDEERGNKNYEIMYKWENDEKLPFNFKIYEDEFIEDRWPCSDQVPDLLGRLISESARARTCAFRGDGLKVGGNIFATGLRANGRFRIKYAKVDQALQLYGARFHSSEIIKHDLDQLQQKPNGGAALSAWATSRQSLPMREVRKLGDYALDIREASFGGDVTMRPDWGTRSWHVVNSRKGTKARGAQHKLAYPSIIEGSVGARGVKINGDFDFTGVISIMESYESLRTRKEQEYGEQHKSEVELIKITLLNLDHGELGGDLVLEQTQGFPGLSAEQAHIRGDVRFGPRLPAPDVEWSSKKCCSMTPIIRGKLQQKEPGSKGDQSDESNLIKAHRKSLEYLSPKIAFQSARIEGNAIVLFNPLFGPELDFQFAHIGGHLEILPWFRNECRWPKDVDRHYAHYAGAAPALIEEDHRRLQALYEKTPSDEAKKTEARKCFDKDSSSADEQRRHKDTSKNWTIDLRHATAGVFTDHPLAWPRQNGLLISRFVYHAARRAGPLAPFPLPHEIARWEKMLWMLIVAFVAMASLFIFVRDYRNAFGLFNLILFTLWGLVCLFLFMLSRIKQTTRKSAEPMAIPWLSLQETEETARDHEQDGRTKRRGRIYWRLMPYIQAADVLRAEGRFVEAGLVETARLKQWRNSLSIRIHFVPSTFLFMVDLVSEYGFNPTRTALTVCGVVLVGAMAFHFGNERCHATAWISTPPLAGKPLEATQPPEPMPASKGAQPHRGTLNPKGPPFATGQQHLSGSKPLIGRADLVPAPKQWPPPFESLVYSADITVPFLNLREQDHWEIVKAACDVNSPALWPIGWLQDLLDGTDDFRWLKVIGELIGVGLAALIATAIITRARLWLARIDE